MKMRKFITVLVTAALTVSSMSMLVSASDTQESMSEGFKAILNDEGKFVMNSIKPSSDMELDVIFYGNEAFREDYSEFFFDYFSEDFTSCTITYSPDSESSEIEEHVVDIVYEYDADIKAEVDTIIESLPETASGDTYYFSVEDMELINWWQNSRSISTLIDYSSEFKEYIDYKNFTLDCRMGDGGQFFTSVEGFAPFRYDGVIYGAKQLGVKANHVIYVPDTTGDTAEELAAAAQKRIDEYAGEGVFEVTYVAEGVLDYLVSEYDLEIEAYNATIKSLTTQITECDNEIAKYDARIIELEEAIANCTDEAQLAEYNNEMNTVQSNKSTTEQNKNELLSQKTEATDYVTQIEEYKMYTCDSYYNEDGENNFLQQAEGDYYFVVESEYVSKNIIIIKDSDKAVEPEYMSSDVSTNVMVSSTATSIPLDTKISVGKLTEGEEFDAIMEVLQVDNSESFDIKLFSASIKEYISELETGKFSVKIPVSSSLKDKSLTAYYVDENKKIHEYKVTVEGDYAIFETDHFSVYTLAAKATEEIVIDDGVAVIPESVMEEAIASAATGDAVVLPLESNSVDVSSVNIPVNSLKGVSDAQKALTIKTTQATITIDVNALDKIVSEAGNEASITLMVDEVKEDSLNSEQQEAIKDKDVAMVISAEIICNGKNITDFGEGKVKVQIPFEPATGTNGSDYKIIYVADDGKLENIATSYKDGFLVVELEHFSEYVVVNMATGNSANPPTGNTGVLWLSIGLMGMVVVAWGGILVASRRKVMR